MRPRAWRITMWTSLAATVLLAGAAIPFLFIVVSQRTIVSGNGGGTLQETYRDVNLRPGWQVSFLPAAAALGVSAFSAFRLYRHRR